MCGIKNNGTETAIARKQNMAMRQWCAAAACLVVLLCSQTAVLGNDVDLRARRVKTIKGCTHGHDDPCSHGRAWHVDANAPNASDDNDGTVRAPFKTINHAAQLALPGDTVLVSNGVYREHVSPGHCGYDVAHMITYAAKNRHQVIIKGSEIWQPKWHITQLQGVQGTIWQTPLDSDLFTYDFPVENFNPFVMSDDMQRGPPGFYKPNRPSADDAFPRTIRGMIFMDGQMLEQAHGLTDFTSTSDVFFVAADGKSIYARFNTSDPNAHAYEITTREQVFAPKTTGVGFIHVKGFVMEHGATRPAHMQYGMVSPSSANYSGASHWIIEDNIIRWSNACGLDIGSGYWGPGRSTTRGNIDEEFGEKPDWTHWIKGNDISDNGQAAIWAIGGAGKSIIEYNRLERNCWQNNIHMVEAAALKFHGVSDVIIRGNLVRDNDNFGLWLDIVGANNRITQNLLINNMTAAVFIEGTWGHNLVDNNIAAFTRTFAFRQMNMGDGFYNHQASHVSFINNLSFANGGYGYRCLMWGLQRASNFPDKHIRVSHNRVLNNIAYANGRGAIALPLDQEFCKDNQSDHNFIWGASSHPLFELHRAIMPPDEMMVKVEEAMVRAHAGPDQVPLLNQWKRGLLGPNIGDMRHFGPLVSLDVWRAAQGWDLRSVVGPLPGLWLSRHGQMRIKLDPPDRPTGLAEGESERVFGGTPESYERLDRVKCVALPEIKYDYFGDVRPTDVPPTVGPFQDLTKLGQGTKEPVFIKLWPLDESRQPPAVSLRYSWPDPQLDEQEKRIGQWAKKVWAEIERADEERAKKRKAEKEKAEKEKR